MAYVTGFFISNIDEWILKEEKIARPASVIPPRPSCAHMNMENCKTDNPKYCPECGKKTRVLPEEKITEIKVDVFCGYLNNLFNKKECFCKGSPDCLNCDSFLKEEYQYDYDDFNYTDISSYKFYPEVCDHYSGPCLECVRKYFESLRCYYLKEGYKLCYFKGEFFIPCLVSLTYDKGDADILTVDGTFLNLREKMLEYCNRNGIKGDFEVKYFGDGPSSSY